MGKRKKQTALILRKARLGKGITQQYVAVNANTNVRAYQRLESGEREIRNCRKINCTSCLSEFAPAALSSVSVAPLRLPPPPCRNKYILRNLHNLFFYSSLATLACFPDSCQL